MEVVEKMKVLLTASIFEVFEKMFFIYLEPNREDHPVFSMETNIKFAGPVDGDMRMFLSEGMASLMVKNMMGLEDCEVTDSLKEDCAREALNMVCGNLLRTYDRCQVYNLSIPQFKKNKNLKLPGIPEREQSHSFQSLFDSDGESLAVLLQFQN